MRVAIDVGHSVAQPGATSATGRLEYDFNKRFSEELVYRSRDWQRLELILLNPTGIKVDLARRAADAGKVQADVLLSIHHDSVQKKYLRQWRYNGRVSNYSDAFRGFSLFVWDKSRRFQESLALASRIGRNLRSAGLRPTLHHAEPIPGEGRPLLDRVLGIYSAPFAVLKSAEMPAVLFEVGILVNRDEEKDLDEPSYRARIQSEVLGALVDHCSMLGKTR